MIETVGLTRRFGDILAVDNLNLKVDDGEVFGFIGPNGAGKTTSIRMLCCLISPSDGTAYIDKMDVRNPEEALRIRGMIGLLPEVPGLYESLSAQRNLDFYARLYGVPEAKREERIRTLLQTLGVWDRRNDAVGKFSKGMKQKIAIARALIHEPELLFLDEPTSGLDPEAAVTVRTYILDLKKEGHTIFLNTHNLDDAERLCDKIGVMKTNLLALGSPSELSHMFWGKTTVVHLKEVRPEYVTTVQGLEGVKDVKVLDNKLLIDIDDLEKRNPIIVEELVRKGGRIEYVNELKRGLEDVYLKLLGGKR